MAPPTTVSPPAATAPQSTDSATRGNIRVDDAIAKACGLPTPRFDFDSARIDGDAARSLDKVTACFVSGALRGKTCASWATRIHAESSTTTSRSASDAPAANT